MQLRPTSGSTRRAGGSRSTPGGNLRLRQSSRDIPLLVMPNGEYVMASGVLPGNPVRFSRTADGMQWLEIQDIETVRWTSGSA